MNRISLFYILILLAKTMVAQVNIEGYIYLENQSSFDSVQIIFERNAPSTYFDTTYSNTNGYYNVQIESGIYNIYFLKEGFFEKTINDISLYSDITINSDTLQQKGTYINVPNDFTLIQDAIDNSTNGDTILVENGIYYENINFNYYKYMLNISYLCNTNKTNGS